MNFAIKVGDKYLTDIDYIRQTLKFEAEPRYFSRVLTSNRVNNILDLMRWGDVPLDLIKIIPEEV